MGMIHGKQAAIYWDTAAAQSDINLTLGQSWSLDVSCDVEPITSMQDDWETFLPGFTDWTATVECLQETTGPKIPIGGDDGMGDDEVRLDLYLVFDSGTPTYKTLYGDAICTGISPGLDKDGIATITYTFQGIAVLAWSSGATRPA